MEGASITRPFTMEVNGHFVVNPPKDSEDEQIPSKVGDRNDAAVFKLSDGYLTSGDHYMGRFYVEPRAFMPMNIYWMKARDAVQACQNSGTEEEPKLETNGFVFGTPRGDGMLCAMPEMMGPSDVKLHWQ